MNAERLLQHYEKIADAPDAIGRLRRFILDLAVRGKLVPQDANDEPASELIKQIAKEKARLVKAGELRKPRDLDTGNGVVEPYAIPSTWRWVRLDGVGAIVGGGTPSATDADNFAEPGEGVPWLTPADLGRYSELYISRGSRDLSEKGARTSSATLMPKGTVLFTSRAPIGYVAIAANPISTNQGFKSIVPYVADCSRFIATAMQAFAPEIDAKAPGTTFKEVSGKIAAAVPFPLPPLAEQRRIVARVDELMGLCDRLEAARGTREATRDRLAGASLARLNAPDAETFQDDARFALAALPALTTRPDQIKRLRQTILNLAVRGKLVPQDPNDEPASELLKRIAKERADLVKRKEFRREDPLDPIPPADMPFDVPETWVWSRIGDAVLFTQYGTSQKSNPSEKGVPVLTMGNVQDGLVVWNNEKRIPETSEDLPALYLLKFDLLYNRTNSAELVGKTGIYLGEDGVRTFASYLIRLRPSLLSSNPRFLNMAMNTPEFRETQILPLIKKQTGQANVNGTALKNMLIPLPPLAEQRRIVARVDELMGLCDRLEASLNATTATRRRLLDALLAEALAPADARELEAAE
jgi:type I restriction enzyme S subunit